MPIKSPVAPYSWQVRLWTHDSAKLYGILSACLVAGFVGWLLFHQILVGIAGFLAIAAATAEYWLPQKYTLDENGASAKCGISVTAIQWNDVKRVIPDLGGVNLSPLEQDGRMSTFRGVYLRFSENREEVLERIEIWRGGGDGSVEG